MMSDKSCSSSPTASAFSIFFLRRSVSLGVIATVIVLSVLVLRDVSRSDEEPPVDLPHLDEVYIPIQHSHSYHYNAIPDKIRPENYLAGPPTAHFRNSLRNDTNYITSWLSAGWTNDVMTIGNLVYLALITSRVPVIPPFTSHIGGNAVPITFSKIFDVPRLIREIRAPVLEWRQIKDIDLAQSTETYDELGGWNIWEVDNVAADGPRGSYTQVMLNLDISYTRAPEWVKMYPGFEHDSHSTFWSLARLAFPETRAEILSKPDVNPTRPSDLSGVVLPPDKQLLCIDYLYYVCAAQTFEYDYDFAPAWRFAVSHFHWTQDLERLALGYLRRTLNLSEREPIPPYITIHARRRDFVDWCGDVPHDECFASLPIFARRVSEVQQELRERRGINAQHVIMTGDEADERWWDNVREMGWLRVDHVREQTEELYGRWYTVILDAVIQSKGIGFVGTDRSTFSILARRRVQDWNDGAVRTVKWGYADADAH